MSSSGLTQQQRQRRSDARKRWRLLAKALTGCPEAQVCPVDGEDGDEDDDEEEVSVRRFGSFGLLRASLLGSESDCTWWLYSGKLGRRFRPQLLVSTLRNGGFSAEQLVGFNNTGNVCVWPSEECLAYYLLKRPELCRGKRVLELGGGMSCLAGALAAKYCSPRSLTLTDGNPVSVANASRIVERNGLAPVARCAVVQWARAAKALNSQQQRRSLAQELSGEDVYDVVLCADCLFFDEARLDLVDTIYGWLADDGLALVMAPYRGSTFRKFVDAMVQKGFVVRQTEMYDSEIWARHLHLLATNRDYCPDLHYPVLLEFTKKRIPSR
ncbi:hypothetical protein QAD02_012504 [Eretmocerus hayati]|uniref:Uncharacterized protein n=1 Tax=Eretmocerus hayati TaxID=131215 RepID=A0ACC2P005_9HYME|nr:hypothetical protein QAD02_012504 [Eretmocerus hayati]